MSGGSCVEPVICSDPAFEPSNVQSLKQKPASSADLLGDQALQWVGHGSATKLFNGSVTALGSRIGPC